MKVGYARTSTTEQQAGFGAQLRELQAAGCEKRFKEQVSSVGTCDISMVGVLRKHGGPSGLDLAASGAHSCARSSGAPLMGTLASATTSFTGQLRINNLHSFDT